MAGMGVAARAFNVADTKAHIVPGRGNDLVAAAMRLRSHGSERLFEASDVGSLFEMLNEDRGTKSMRKKAWTIYRCC